MAQHPSFVAEQAGATLLFEKDKLMAGFRTKLKNQRRVKKAAAVHFNSVSKRWALQKVTTACFAFSDPDDRDKII